MRAENYIIKGVLFRVIDKSNNISNEINNLRILITRYFENNGYVDISPNDFLTRYPEHRYILRSPVNVSKLKKILGRTETKQRQDAYFNILKTTREDVPGEIYIHFYTGKYKEVEGFYIEIVSKPVKYLKILQLKDMMDISEQKYSCIISENKQFIECFAKAMISTIINSPIPLSMIVKTEVQELLERTKFVKTAEILKLGKENLETGQIREAISELKALLENFLFELLQKLDEIPKGLQKPEENISFLLNKGYLSNEGHNLVYASWFRGCYSKITDKDHNKIQMDIYDIRYYYSTAEITMKYLIDKVWLSKVRYKTNDEVITNVRFRS